MGEKMNITTYQRISMMNKKGVFWHGMSSDRAITALIAGSISPHSVQRFWKGGNTYLDNTPLYDTSFWANGWCMSRDMQVSKKFANRGVIFAFSKNAVKSRFKTIPYSWGGSIPNASPETRKKEREEFVLSGGFVESEQYYTKNIELIRQQMKAVREDKSLSRKDKSLATDKLVEQLKNFDFSKDFYQPNGKSLPLDTCFGFFISERKPNTAICEELEKHPLFLGYI